MKYIGSFLALIGGLLVVVVALVSLLSTPIKEIWQFDLSSEVHLNIVAAVLAVMIAILGYLSISTKQRLLGIIIIASSFAGIIVGSTLTDIAMLFSIVGGMALYTGAVSEAEKNKTQPECEQAEGDKAESKKPEAGKEETVKAGEPKNS